MKRILLTMRSYALGLLLCLVAVLSGCSADSEISYSDDLMTVPRAKMQVMELAQKYGLTVEVNDSLLAARMADGTFSLKKVEEMLQDFSGVVGVYPLTREGNSVRLNTRKERLLMKNRGAVLPDKEESRDSIVSGSLEKPISGSNSKGNRVSMTVKVSWEYNPHGSNKCSYSISDFEPEDKYRYSKGSVTVSFSGEKKAPSYSFTITCTPKNSDPNYLTIRLEVTGNDTSMSVL